MPFVIFNPSIGGFYCETGESDERPDERLYSFDPADPEVFRFETLQEAWACVIPPERIYSIEEVETLQRIHDTATARAVSPLPSVIRFKDSSEVCEEEAEEAEIIAEEQAATLARWNEEHPGHTIDYGGTYQGDDYCPDCIERIANTLRSEGAIEPAYPDSQVWPMACIGQGLRRFSLGIRCAGDAKCCHAVEGIAPELIGRCTELRDT